MAVTTKEKSDAIQTNMLRNRCGSNYRIPATDVTGPMDWPPLRISVEGSAAMSVI